jgi:hypothetical protein
MRIKEHFHATKMQLHKLEEKDKKSLAQLQGSKTPIIMKKIALRGKFK